MYTIYVDTVDRAVTCAPTTKGSSHNSNLMCDSFDFAFYRIRQIKRSRTNEEGKCAMRHA